MTSGTSVYRPQRGSIDSKSTRLATHSVEAIRSELPREHVSAVWRIANRTSAASPTALDGDGRFVPLGPQRSIGLDHPLWSIPLNGGFGTTSLVDVMEFLRECPPDVRARPWDRERHAERS